MKLREMMKGFSRRSASSLFWIFLSYLEMPCATPAKPSVVDTGKEHRGWDSELET